MKLPNTVVLINFLSLTAIFIFSWLIFSCANQTAPTGGPKDTIPPTLVNTTPRNETINYNGSPIQLEFTEHVSLNNPKEQLLITPSLESDFEMYSKKNTVILKLNPPLEKNTTYNLNFRETIQDITEKNKAKAIQLAFSTGTYIDSMTLKGTVYNALTTEPESNFTIGLYKSDTFNIFEHQPVYISFTDKQGKFTFKNLKPTTYKVYAFRDKNKNLKIDSKSESYAFLVDSTTTTFVKSTDSLTLYSYSQNIKPINITSSRPNNTHYLIKLSRAFATYKIDPIHHKDSLPFTTMPEKNQESIKIYAPNLSSSDSIPIHLQIQDSINSLIDTTIYLKKIERNVKPDKFSFALENSKITIPTATLEAEFNYNKPIKSITYDSIFYELDSLTKLPVVDSAIEVNQEKGKIFIRIPVDPHLYVQQQSNDNLKGSNPEKKLLNSLHLGQGAFISIENDSTQSITVKPTINTSEKLATIITQVQTSEPHFIIQLLNSKGKVVRETLSQTNYTFSYLQPDTYQLRLIIDRNNDGKWNPGNFFNKLEPEPVKFYSNEKNIKKIELLANWELGPLLLTYP